MVCYTNIIGIWCDMIIVTISIVFAWKQYRKLNMVIQWSIIDLSVRGSIELKKYIRMKRRFNRIFTTLWIGVSCLLVANIIDFVSHTTQNILRLSTHPFTDRLLCDTTTHSEMYVCFQNPIFVGIIGSFSISTSIVSYSHNVVDYNLYRLPEHLAYSQITYLIDL